MTKIKKNIHKEQLINNAAYCAPCIQAGTWFSQHMLHAMTARPLCTLYLITAKTADLIGGETNLMHCQAHIPNGVWAIGRHQSIVGSDNCLKGPLVTHP